MDQAEAQFNFVLQQVREIVLEGDVCGCGRMCVGVCVWVYVCGCGRMCVGVGVCVWVLVDVILCFI